MGFEEHRVVATLRLSQRTRYHRTSCTCVLYQVVCWLSCRRSEKARPRNGVLHEGPLTGANNAKRPHTTKLMSHSPCTTNFIIISKYETVKTCVGLPQTRPGQRDLKQGVHMHPILNGAYALDDFIVIQHARMLECGTQGMS